MGKALTARKNPAKKNMTGGQSIAQLGKEIQDLRTQIPRLVPLESIPVLEIFETLFPIKEQNRESIAASIRSQGFDPKKAVLIGVFPDGRRSLVDGYTRRAGAREVGLSEIYAWEQEFDSIEDAVDWALHEQMDRRNISEAEMYEFVLRVDQIKGKGRKDNGYKGRSSQRTADIVGTSPRTVERIRSVANLANEEQIQEIRSGEKSVYRIYQEIKGSRPKKTEAPPSEEEKPPVPEEVPHTPGEVEPEGAQEKAKGAEDKEMTPRGVNSSDPAPKKPERNWAVEVRGSSLTLIRGKDELPLVNFSTMETLYGAPSEKLRKVVEVYLEGIL